MSTSAQGSAATADIEVSGGTVTGFTIVNAGDDYRAADQLSATLPGADIVTPGTGAVITISAPTGGDGLDSADGTVTGVAASSTTSTAGSGATFDLTILGGEVTDVQLNEMGLDYESTDEITIAASDIQGSATGNDLVFTIDTVDEDVSTPGPDVTVTATVDTISN